MKTHIIKSENTLSFALKCHWITTWAVPCLFCPLSGDKHPLHLRTQNTALIQYDGWVVQSLMNSSIFQRAAVSPGTATACGSKKRLILPYPASLSPPPPPRWLLTIPELKQRVDGRRGTWLGGDGVHVRKLLLAWDSGSMPSRSVKLGRGLNLLLVGSGGVFMLCPLLMWWCALPCSLPTPPCP